MSSPLTPDKRSTPWWQGELLFGSLTRRYAFVHWCHIPDPNARHYGNLEKKYLGLSWRRFHVEVSW